MPEDHASAPVKDLRPLCLQVIQRSVPQELDLIHDPVPPCSK